MVSGKSVAKLFCMFLAVSAVALFGIMPGARLAAQSTGAVYVLSNQPVENAVIVFHRNADGTLLPGGSFPTGGAGFGSGPNPLGSQGALMLSADNRLLFAVNAGSDSITAFAVAGDSLTTLQTVPSGGTKPVSLTVYKDHALRAELRRRITQHYRFPDHAGSAPGKAPGAYSGLDAIPPQ